MEPNGIMLTHALIALKAEIMRMVYSAAESPQHVVLGCAGKISTVFR